MELPPFQALLDSYGRDVHRFLLANVGAGDADDCYQETWIAALRGYPRLQHSTNLRGWLLTIASRKAIDCARARRRVPLPVGDVPEVAAPAERDPDGDPWAAVRTLPPKQRIAVAMRYALDAEYSAVADAMGISEDAARRNVHEGLKRLRREHDDDRL
jgi:DNA-directed RNA polymerase specialized sigma24 family protein